MPLIKHIVDDQNGGARNIPGSKLRTFGELRIGVQQCQIIAVAFELHRIARHIKAVIGLQSGLQHFSQRRTATQDAEQQRIFGARHQRKSLARHAVEHKVERGAVVKTEALTGDFFLIHFRRQPA